VKFILGIIVAAWAIVSPAMAETVNGIEVTEVWARVFGDETSIYVTIVNHTQNDDALLSVTSPRADRMTLQRVSVKKMKANRRGLDSIRVPAMGKVRLRPGGQYIAIEQLREPLRPGESIPVTLIFRKAGQVETAAIVNNQSLGNRGR
jgi:copper(I)-binding protein